VKALSWKEVERLANKLDELNPYDRTVVRDSILKIEDVNWIDGEQRELQGYAVAAKRYELLTYDKGDLIVVKASAHGLGFLCPPKSGYHPSADAPVWVVEAWDWLSRQCLGLAGEEPHWFELAAMMRLKITTPEVLKILQARQSKLPFRERIKPFNFILSPMIDEDAGHPVDCDRARFTLIAPFTPNTSKWFSLKFVNTHDGKIHRLGRPGRRLPFEAEPQTLRDVISRYRWHPEAKSLAPDGSPCDRRTAGLLKRTHVIAADQPRVIGKETDRRWDQGEDISLLESEVPEYRSNETAQLLADPDLQSDIYTFSIRVVAKKAGVSENTVKAARRGERLRRSTVERLNRALKELMAGR